MKSFTLVICLLFFLLQSLDVIAQKLTVEQMREDLAVFEENLFAVHIDVDRYHSEASIRQSFDEIERSLVHPLHPVDFYRSLLPIFPLIANGHTVLRPPQSYFDSLRTKTVRFPLDLFSEAEGEVQVLRDMSADSIVGVGVHVLSVNGRPVNELLDEMVSMMTRDGFNRSLPYQNAINAFKSFYAFHYGCPPFFDLVIRTPDGEEIAVRLPALPLAEIAELRRKRYQKHWTSYGDEEFKAYDLQIEDGVGVMTLNTFSKKHVKKVDGRSYKKFFKEAFIQLDEEGVEHLIIDLRNNGGGDVEPTIALFAYLHPEPFTFYRSMTTKVSHVPNRKLYNGNLFFNNLFSRFVTRKRDDGHYDVKGVAGMKESSPEQPHFGGEVYVLTGPQSFSATGEMTAILKEHDRVIFIGEEPGGNPNVNISGYMPRLILPHSKVQVTMSLVRFEMNVNFDSQGRGIIPDHHVSPRFEDARDGVDTVMEYARELIREKK